MKKLKSSLGFLLVALTPLVINTLVSVESSFASEKYAQLNTIEAPTIHVNPTKGDDGNDGASKQSSLKTITKALEIAKSGTTIQLAWGEYTEETGEVFPLIVKENIALKGSPGSRGHNIIIRGNGYFISPTGAGQNVAIAATKDAGQIMGITVINSHNRGHGLWIESASPQVIGNTFTRNGNTGVSANGDSDPLIEDNLFYNNAGNGLLVYGTSQPEVKANFFEKTGFGVSAVQDAAPILTGNDFSENRIGVILEGNASAILQDNKIENSSEYGLTAIANSRVDLGTSERPGNNIFKNNGKLDIQNATSNEIVAVGTEIDGSTAGKINFANGNAITVAANTDRQKPLSPLLPERAEQSLPPALPAPLPQTKEDSQTQELVFNAPPASQPVPYPPETKSSNLPPSPPTTASISHSPLNVNRDGISSLSDLLSSNNSSGAKYKVLVEVKSDRDKEDVRELYPEAFPTNYRGRSAMQVGAFTNWNKAKQAWRSLEDMGLNSYLLE